MYFDPSADKSYRISVFGLPGSSSIVVVCWAITGDIKPRVEDSALQINFFHLVKKSIFEGLNIEKRVLR